MSDNLKELYEAKCAEAEALRDKARRAWFAYGDALGKPYQFDTAMRELYEAATFSEAGKPLLEKMNRLTIAASNAEILLRGMELRGRPEEIYEELRRALNLASGSAQKESPSKP